MAAMKRNRRSDQKIAVTVDSVDAEALRLLETNPSEYFRKTHKRLPFGFTASEDSTETD